MNDDIIAFFTYIQLVIQHFTGLAKQCKREMNQSFTFPNPHIQFGKDHSIQTIGSDKIFKKNTDKQQV